MIEAKTMARKKRASNGDASVKPKPKPRATSYVAPPCSACAALRPAGENFTRVETTRGRVRYCRCTFCNNLFKDVPAVG